MFLGRLVQPCRNLEPSVAGGMHFFKKLNSATGEDAIFLKIEKCIRGFETVDGVRRLTV